LLRQIKAGDGGLAFGLPFWRELGFQTQNFDEIGL